MTDPATRHRRIGARRTGILIVTIIVSLITATCSENRPAQDGSVETKSLTAKGGTVTLDGMTVSVPAGAVASKTKLTLRRDATSPSPRASSVLSPITSIVNVTLPDGAQPRSPVTVSAMPTDPAQVAAAAAGEVKLAIPLGPHSGVDA